MSQGHEHERQPFSEALRSRIKAAATVVSQIWEGYNQTPTAC